MRGQPWPVMGSSPERRKRRKEGRGGAARRWHGGLLGGAMGRGCGRCSLLVLLPLAAFCTTEQNWKEEGQRRRKRKGRN
jgi:hypothetical protein